MCVCENEREGTGVCRLVRRCQKVEEICAVDKCKGM